MAREKRQNASKVPYSTRTSTKRKTMIWKVILYIAIPCNLLLLYRIMFSGIVPVEFEYPQSINFTGSLHPNSIISSGRKILSNSIVGPESVVFDTFQNMYTGIEDGRILKIYPSSTGELGEGLVEDFYKLPVVGVNPTDGVKYRGRPLGLRIKDNQLYVAYAFHGLYSIDLANKSLRILVRSNDVSPPMKLTNDLTLSADGSTLYFTDSSYKWNFDTVTLAVMEGTCRGRIFKFDTATARTELFASGLCFANGVELSEDGNVLLVSEMTQHRITYFDIKSKKIIRQILLPGMPGNIRRYNHKYWVGVTVLPSKFLARFAHFPTLRRITAAVIPYNVLDKFSNNHYGLAIELSKDGSITRSLHDPSGDTIYAVTQITETESGDLFVCSFLDSCFVKVKI